MLKKTSYDSFMQSIMHVLTAIHWLTLNVLYAESVTVDFSVFRVFL